MTTLHIHRVPTREYSRRDLGERWCFVCRKRRAFVDVVSVPTDPMSYYGPHATVKCECGHADGDLFPGWTRNPPDAD